MPWLMKAEPDSRIVKGKDVKFSVDDFEKLGVSPWDGVRNHEAKKIMKEKMKMGDKVLFYHSNCKTPGVFAIAEIVKEGYPDHTAWDSDHPYYDAKTNKDDPTWFMVDVRFVQRLTHPPTLALIKYLAAAHSLPDEVSYIGQEGWEGIRAMQLVNRGRLSVQPVDQVAYDAVVLLGTQGGFESLLQPKARATKSTSSKPPPQLGTGTPTPKSSGTSIRPDDQVDNNGIAPSPKTKTKTKTNTTRPQMDAPLSHSEHEVDGEPLGKDEQRKTKRARVVPAEKLGERRSQRLKR